MLPRSQRVRLTADIQRVYKQGVSIRHSLLRLGAVPAEQEANKGTSRATVVVSKQVHLHATVRNRIKRRIRVALRAALPQLKRPLDIVVSAQPKATTATQAELTTAVNWALQKIKL